MLEGSSCASTMDLSEGSTTDDLWTPYKELVSVVEGYLTTEDGEAPYAVHTFESVLRRHKQTFLNLFKYPTKNASSRDEIKRGITDGVVLPSVGRTLLSKELVDEAVIISDMYNVNEYLALELLHTAQRQMPRHPGLPRGLVAVLLYYDGRRALVQALKEIFMARDGVCWSTGSREEVVAYVTRYANGLVSGGALSGALDALRSPTDAALQLLHTHRALPPPPYHARLLHALNSTRKLLAGVVFAASAQRGLERDILLRVLSEQTTSPSLGPTGALDEISLALQMALLYALDLSVLHRREDGEELAKKLALLSEPSLLSELVERLTAEPSATERGGARALAQLSLGLALAALKRAPHSLLRSPHHHLKLELLDHDELLVDTAIDAGVFEYLDESILSTEFVSKEEYYQRRIHTLITDFIVLMHPKLMEMRVKAEESHRAAAVYAAEGLAPPASAPPRLHALLRCVERLYSTDPHRLRDDYWQACTTTQRSGGRAAALYKFVRLSGELVSAALVPAYLRALAALSVARHTWPLLARRDALSAHHALTALTRYYRSLRGEGGAPPQRAPRPVVRHEEVEALIAALKLLESVAREDSNAAAAICENLQWDAVNVMFGVMSCAVPLTLKAALCDTLAALGGWPATAPRVWAALDGARLVAPHHERCSLALELDEVECRLEEYPLSLAFVGLLDSLTAAAPLPRALGAGWRTPGLRPYLQHVVRRLALPAPHRRYARPQEQWQMMGKCLCLLERWLANYEPAAADLADEEAAPPGARIALDLHADSELLRLVLVTVERALPPLEAYPPPPEREWIERALCASLALLDRALEIERALSAAAASAPRATPPLGLAKLMLLPEEGASRCRLVWWCRCVRLTATLPEAGARAVRLVARALQHAAAARDLLAAVSHPGTDTALLRYGFVECLEAEEWGPSVDRVRAAKQGVLDLITALLPTAAPNMAHFLLGFELRSDVSRSSLHEPGAAGAPRTALHAVLDALDSFISGASHAEADELTARRYRLIAAACSGNGTGPPMLRYLRSRDYFLARHVRRCVEMKGEHALASRSWLLRAVACELAAAAGARHRAALGALVAALVHGSPAAGEWRGCALRRLLDAAPTCCKEPLEPHWEVFSAGRLRAAVTECERNGRISVPRLHALLARELAAAHASAPQRALVADEIRKVLEYVTEVNARRELAAALAHHYDSWRQLTEMLFCAAPRDALDLEARKNLLLAVLQDLLNKIAPDTALPLVADAASGTVLLLLVNLRHCYALQKQESDLKGADFESSFFGAGGGGTHTNSLALKFILRKILSWICCAGGCTQRMRVNLYGALLNLLHLVSSRPVLDTEPEPGYVSRLDSSRVKAIRDTPLRATVVDVIDDFGENLCSVVCGDCIGAGHDVCRMLALACLETVVEVNPRTDWMHAFTERGYLRSLIDSLHQDDKDLKEALEASPSSLRALYVYESKLALLRALSRSRRGAEAVLSAGAVARLAELNALQTRPQTIVPVKHAAFLPAAPERFRQAWVPALALCAALLTALPDNHSCALHVAHFLLAHLDNIDLLLRSVQPDSPAEELSEAELVTWVSSRAVRSEALAAAGAPAAARLRSLLRQLLARFQHPPPNPTGTYYKIVCNLTTYAVSAETELGGAGAALLARLAPLVRTHHKLLASATHRRRALPTTTLDELRRLVPEAEAGEGGEEARGRAAAALAAAEQARRAELAAATLALEAAAALLSIHLRNIRAAGSEEALALRKEVATLLNERFTEELLDTAKNQPAPQRSFLEVLVKDIKNMIQFSVQ